MDIPLSRMMCFSTNQQLILIYNNPLLNPLDQSTSNHKKCRKSSPKVSFYLLHLRIHTSTNFHYLPIHLLKASIKPSIFDHTFPRSMVQCKFHSLNLTKSFTLMVKTEKGCYGYNSNYLSI